jgi:putative transcriptional regulator
MEYRLYCLAMIVCTLPEVLKRKKWSRYRLQKVSGISYPTLHALFHGTSKAYSADVLDRLCDALKCEPGDLLKRVKNRPSKKRRR